MFNERNTWTATYKVPANKTVTAADVAAALTKQLKAKSDAAGLNLTIANTEAKITVTSSDKTVDWELKTADDLYGVSITFTPATNQDGTNGKIRISAGTTSSDEQYIDIVNNGIIMKLSGMTSFTPGYILSIKDNSSFLQEIKTIKNSTHIFCITKLF